MKKSLFARFQSSMIRVGVARTLPILMQLDDHTLRAAGISRDLLNQGVTAWPWRLEENADAHAQPIVHAPIPQAATVSGLGDNFKHAA